MQVAACETGGRACDGLPGGREVVCNSIGSTPTQTAETSHARRHIERLTCKLGSIATDRTARGSPWARFVADRNLVRHRVCIIDLVPAYHYNAYLTGSQRVVVMSNPALALARAVWTWT